MILIEPISVVNSRKSVTMNITAPLYWWTEFDGYNTDAVNVSCIKMSKIYAKEFTLDDFSHEHLSCWGAATRGNDPALAPEGESGLMNETVSEFAFDYFGCLLGTIHALNGARAQYLRSKDKQFWWQMIQLLPSSYNQKRTVMMSYEVLSNMYANRWDHKLDEWPAFCKVIEELPYSEIIIID